jgi:hypothetical protein
MLIAVQQMALAIRVHLGPSYATAPARTVAVSDVGFSERHPWVRVGDLLIRLHSLILRKALSATRMF